MPDGSWNPFGVVTDLGDTLVRTRVSPARFEVHLAAAYARSLERRIATKWRAASDIAFMQFDHRLAHEPAARAIASAKVGRVGRGVARVFVCNAVWTRERLVRVGGLLLDPTCQLCGKLPDAAFGSETTLTCLPSEPMLPPASFGARTKLGLFRFCTRGGRWFTLPMFGSRLGKWTAPSRLWRTAPSGSASAEAFTQTAHVNPMSRPRCAGPGVEQHVR